MAWKYRAVTFDNMWVQLEEAMDRVYRGSEQLSPNIKLKTYTLVYEYCTTATPTPTRTPIQMPIYRNNRLTLVQDGASVLGAELYAKLQSYLEAYLYEMIEEGLDLQGEDLLRFYTTNWEGYRSASKTTNAMCKYFNRHWVRSEYNSGRRDIYEVYLMAMKIWQLIVFQALHRQLTLACLQLIKVERDNEKIDTKLISNVIQSYVEIDLSDGQCFSDDRNRIQTRKLAIYKDYFELPFLQSTAQFYRHEAATFLDHNSVTEYLKKVTQRLNEEERRVQSYLHPSTAGALIKKVEEVLIRNQLEKIYKEAETLLHDEKREDLALLFKLVSRVPNATLELKNIVENHVRQMGIDAIGRTNGNALNDPKLYGETVLGIYTESSKLVQEAFNNEQDFIAAVDKVCIELLNNNTVSTNLAELLADTLSHEGTDAAKENLNKLLALISISN